MPTDARLYVNALTLLVFLLLRIPAIWQGVGFTRGERNLASLAGGAAAIVAGSLTLTVHLWAASTHTFGGVNYAAVWPVTLALLGWGFILGGVGWLVKGLWAATLAGKNHPRMWRSKSAVTNTRIRVNVR